MHNENKLPDDLIQEGKKTAIGSSFYGVFINEMGLDDLIATVGLLMKTIDNDRKQHIIDLEDKVYRV